MSKIENKKENKYKKCVFKNDKRCGMHKKNCDENIYLVGDLDNSCKNHLMNLQLFLKHDEDPGITEKQLIETRCKRELEDTDSICVYHRYLFGIYYKQSLKCFHPGHITHKAGNKTRAATLLQLFHLKGKNSESHFPIGGQLCMRHIKQINKEIRDFENNTLNDSIVSEYQIKNHEALSFEDLEKPAQIQSNISSMLNVSPPSWQVKRKSIGDLSNNSIRSLKSRYKKAKCALKEKLAESVAPGQASDLAGILSSSDEDENTARLSNDTAALSQVYKTVISLGNWFHCLFHQKH